MFRSAIPILFAHIRVNKIGGHKFSTVPVIFSPLFLSSIFSLVNLSLAVIYINK